MTECKINDAILVGGKPRRVIGLSHEGWPIVASPLPVDLVVTGKIVPVGTFKRRWFHWVFMPSTGEDHD